MSMFLRAAAVVCVGLLASTASADLMFSFTPEASGGVKLTGSGSGQVSASKTDDDWQLYFVSQFIPGGNIAPLAADSVSGTITNVTTSMSQPIQGSQVDSDVINDEIRWLLPSSLAFTSGDEYTISLQAEFDLLNIADLVEGTFTESGVGGDEIFGSMQISVVPEPSAATMLGILGLGMAFRRWKQRVSIS